MAILTHRRTWTLGTARQSEATLLPMPAHQAYRILHVGFVIAPLIAGLDKFTNLLVDWTTYLTPTFPQLIGVSKATFMMGVGVIEIAAAVLVLLAPAIGGYVVMAWLWAIILNLLMQGSFYDIALRDFGLSLGALALARLAWAEHEARRTVAAATPASVEKTPPVV